MDKIPAIVFQHPSAPVVFQVPHLHEFAPVTVEPEVAVPAALMPELHNEEDAELLAITDGLTNLIQKHGAPRIMRLVRMIAHLAGQDVPHDRPSHLCLADGAALKNNLCVRCGRDNS
jgi:hypothetical protein